MIVDESQFSGKKFVNVILGELESPKNYFLVEVIELSKLANNSNVSIIIDNVIKKFELSRDHFSCSFQMAQDTCVCVQKI